MKQELENDHPVDKENNHLSYESDLLQFEEPANTKIKLLPVMTPELKNNDINNEDVIKLKQKNNLKLKILKKEDKLIAQVVNDKSTLGSVYESANSTINMSQINAKIDTNTKNVKKSFSQFSDDSSSNYSDTNSDHNEEDLKNDLIFRNKDLIKKYIVEKNFEKLSLLEKENYSRVKCKNKEISEKKWEKIKQRVDKIEKNMKVDNQVCEDPLEWKEKVLFLSNTKIENGGFNIIEEKEFNKKYVENGFCGYNLYYEKNNIYFIFYFLYIIIVGIIIISK